MSLARHAPDRLLILIEFIWRVFIMLSIWKEGTRASGCFSAPLKSTLDLARTRALHASSFCHFQVFALGRLFGAVGLEDSKLSV